MGGAGPVMDSEDSTAMNQKMSDGSELVFPAADGSMMRADCDLEKVLRHAMARAGIVTGYNHVCRRQAAATRRWINAIGRPVEELAQARKPRLEVAR